jgi:hypothetical protein
MRKRFLLGLVAMLAAAAVSAQQVDVTLNSGSYYVDIGQGIPWGPNFNRTYLLTPINPQVGVCVFIVNNNPTSSHTFILNVFTTGDPRVQDYSNNTRRWVSNIISGTPSPVAASATSFAYAATAAAAKIAVQFTASSVQAGNPDTADAYIVQTTTGYCGAVGNVIAVVGPVQNGQPQSGGPVLMGLRDLSGNIWPARTALSTGSLVNAGLEIGGEGALFHNVLTNIQTFNNGTAAMSTAPFLFSQNLSQGVNFIGASNTVAGALETSTAGSIFVDGPSTVTTTHTTVLNNATVSVGGTWGHGCVATATITGSVTGTTPTLDIYIQDSLDQTNWNDRIHFAQATVTGFKQEAAVEAAPITPINMVTNTLAVSTVVNGTLGPQLRVSYVVGGTSPSFGNVQVNLVCR